MLKKIIAIAMLSILGICMLPIPMLADSGDIISLRTETSKTRFLGANKFGVEIVGRPLHYKDNYNNPSEQWKDIDLTWQGNQITKAPYILTVNDKDITIVDKKTNDMVTLLLIDVDSKFKAQTVVTPSSLGFLAKLPHNSSIVVAKNKAVTSFNIKEQSDADKLLPKEQQKGFVDIDDKASTSFIKKVNSDVTVYSSTSDGFTSYGDTNYNTAWAAAASELHSDGWSSSSLGQIKLADTYYIYRNYLYFDTSSISTLATISSATLSLYGQEDLSTTDFLITIQNGMVAGQDHYPHDPMVDADYDKTFYSGDGGSLTTNGFSLAAYNVITLNATGLSWIQKGAGVTTKLCLRNDREIAGTAPTAFMYERVGIWNTEEAGVAKDPKLYVVYAIPVAPTITNNPASSITTSSARLNAFLNDDGGATCEAQWGWGLVNQADNITAYSNNSTYSGSYTTGQSPYLDIGSLSDNTTYFFNVRAQNSAGTDTGTSANFTTIASGLFAEPTNLIATPASTSVSLSWTKGIGTETTIVRGKTSSYPTTYTDGDAIYNGTASTATDSGRTSGETRYYRAWGYATADNYTASYDEEMATLLAATAAGGISLPATTEPDRWFTNPTEAGMADFPLYEPINSFADAFSVPRGTFWLSIAIFIAVMFGMFILIFAKSVMGAMIAVVMVMAIGWSQEIVPFWLLGIFLIIAGSLVFSRRESL